MPLRILYVDHTAKIGGGELALANLVNFINRDEVEPFVLLFEDGPLVERLGPNTSTYIIPLHRAVSNTQKDNLGWASLLNAKATWLTFIQIYRVAKYARDIKADVIHTNSLKADLIGGVAGRIAGIPVIWHIRDRIDFDYLPRPVVHVFRLLSRYIPTFIVANSSATLKTLHLDGRRPSAAIGSGVNVSRYQPDTDIQHNHTNSSISKSLRVGLVGRISPWKGQHVFIQAAAEVLKQHPTATFEIIGAALFDEKDYEQTLHALCVDLNVQKSIHFAGFVQDIPSRILALDILVHASTTGEPYGQVIIEGMAAAKAVIATNGGGVPEIVLDKVTGILVPMGDHVQMAEAIAYLIENPQTMEEMGRLGRIRVLDHFTIEKTAKDMQRVYKELLLEHS